MCSVYESLYFLSEIVFQRLIAIIVLMLVELSCRSDLSGYVATDERLWSLQRTTACLPRYIVFKNVASGAEWNTVRK